MDGLMAINTLNDLSKALEEARRLLPRYGQQRADAEMKYKIALRETCLRLRDEGMPVGLIDKVCYGERKVADARFKRDVADSMYDAAKENINSIKLQMRILENQIAREWGSNG